MRIAFVHSFYASSQPSGENRVVEDQVRLLREAGHEVLLLGRNTDDEAARSRLYPASAALRVATGRGPDPTDRLRMFAPDVVHVVNLFPNIGRDWLHRWPGPIVLTVHNYRFVCSNGLLYRDGAICMECATDGPHRALVHRCYRGSFAATLPLAISRASDQRAVLARADAVVTTSAASDRVLREIVDMPLTAHVIPNFGDGEGVAPLPAAQRSGWIAMGRFTEEKGLLDLVRDWPDSADLTVVGSGEQEAAIRDAAAGRPISVMGTMPREDLRRLLPQFVALVLPSKWVEVAPQVVVEAMRVGLPVVAFEANGVAELVASSGAGAVYRDRASLAAALADVEASCDAMSARAGEHYARYWRPEAWLTAMTGLYERVIADRAPARS